MNDEAFEGLLRAAQAGDERAYAALWRSSNARVLRYLTVVLGRDGADDVAGDVWLDVARSLSRFRGGEDDFRGWLFTIARRRVIDERRRRARRPPVIPMDDLDRAAGGSDPADQVEEATDTAAALALIGSLKPDQAEIVALRVIAGLDVATVAKLVGKSTGSVRVTAHRGLRELARRTTSVEAERDL
jgi:RNA polymerase sigma-70 factor (ECF subfamily)